MSRWVIGLGLLTMVVGIGGAAYGVWTIWNQHHVITTARPIRARVLEHKTKDLKASGLVAKVPLVKYEYMVNQQLYTCETVTPDELMLPDTWAESVFKQFPIGAETQANYNPNDPSRAFLIAKYSVKPYLPLLVSLVIAALGIAIAGEQWTTHETPAMTPTGLNAFSLGAKQIHLARARMLGIVGILGFICGAPAILHHGMVSTSPHERMGFLIEGAYVIAVLTVLIRSAMQFRRGYGFGTPVVTVDRSPRIGQPLQLKISVPTRFTGTAYVNACLKCEAKDTRLFNISEEKSAEVLLQQNYLLANSQPVTKGGEITGTAELSIPDHIAPSTPADSQERTHTVWNLIVTAEGDSGRQAETEYILPVL